MPWRPGSSIRPRGRNAGWTPRPRVEAKPPKRRRGPVPWTRDTKRRAGSLVETLTGGQDFISWLPDGPCCLRPLLADHRDDTRAGGAPRRRRCDTHGALPRGARCPGAPRDRGVRRRARQAHLRAQRPARRGHRDAGHGARSGATRRGPADPVGSPGFVPAFRCALVRVPTRTFDPGPRPLRVRDLLPPRPSQRPLDHRTLGRHPLGAHRQRDPRLRHPRPSRRPWPKASS